MAKVFVSSILPAPIDHVWKRVRDFNGLPDWVPAVVRSQIEQGRPSDAVGCVRSFELRGGEHLREQLLALSDRDYSCTYSILESHMPVEGYVATLRLRPITDGGHTFAEWRAEFGCPPDQEQDLVESIGNDVFLAAFHNLKSTLG